jgi:hypothetical protein
MNKFTVIPTAIADIFNNFVAANINPVLSDDPSYSFPTENDIPDDLHHRFHMG